jgi:predicted transcriptional regulator
MRRGFGELELLILEVLKSGKAMSVKEVMQKLPGDNKYTTIMTVMNRLADKKVLAREKAGLHYNYTIVNSSTRIPSLVQQFMHKMFGLNTAKLVSQLIDASSEMTEDELNELSLLIDAKKKEKHGS